jgi:eukaryotic-like serine/threonine-protein kinase
MTSARWQIVKQLLHDALDQPAAGRSAFLDHACNGDPELRAEVESLLAADQQAGEFLNQPALEQDLAPGSRLGSWRLAESIGRGGMGAVYRAVRDDDQFQQEVAIKVVKRGMDTAAVLSRFRYERQILAFLNHPNIARLIDGGAAPDGRPYLVMELVQGIPITDYCDQNHLGIAERITLFRRVCEAVEYAHRNLIVHRDLKPGNILITASGEPKLLDFGIGKILLPSLPQLRETTQTLNERMLTPDYASPEQVRGDPVTTATDVYSLGAVLYELLSGDRPHHFERLTAAEIERIICEGHIRRPSEVCTLLAGVLRGDLDTIVLKALHKDVALRYPSVEQLSEDLRRYQDGRPVLARSDTITYRARKFVRRHRTGVASAALLVVALVGGAITTAWQARVARWERDRATRWFEGGRRLANAFLIEHDALASIPGGTGLREKLMTDALRYLDALAAESEGIPGIQEELALAYEKMGDVQGRADGPNLGDTAGATESYRKAIILREQLPPSPENLLDLSRSYFRFSGVLRIAGDYQGGIDYDLKALAIREKLFKSDPGNLALLRLLAASHTSLGGSYYHVGNNEAVLTHRSKAHELAGQLLNSPEPTAADYRLYMLAGVRMGSALVRAGQLAAALRHYEQSLAASEAGLKRFPGSPPIRLTRATTLQARGSIWLEQRWFNEALADYRAARDLYETLHNADPKDARTSFMLANAHYRIGIALTAAGRPAAAIPEIQTSLTMREELAARDPANAGARAEVAMSLAAMADANAGLGQRARAAQRYSSAIAILEDLELRKQANTEALAELKRIRERLPALGL